MSHIFIVLSYAKIDKNSKIIHNNHKYINMSYDFNCYDAMSNLNNTIGELHIELDNLRKDLKQHVMLQERFDLVYGNSLYRCACADCQAQPELKFKLAKQIARDDNLYNKWFAQFNTNKNTLVEIIISPNADIEFKAVVSTA
jgi:regulator of replication initiation timing